MKNLSKKTKILLGIFGGVFVIALGLGIYVFATGGLKSSASLADSPLLPGVISGKLACSSDCNGLTGAVVTLTGNGIIRRASSFTSDGSFRFTNLTDRGTEPFVLRAAKQCPPSNGNMGSCQSNTQEVWLTELDQHGDVSLNLQPTQGRLTVNVQMVIPRESGPKPSNCTIYGDSSGRWSCPAYKALVSYQKNGKYVLKFTDSSGNADLGLLPAGSIRLTVEKEGFISQVFTEEVKGCSGNFKYLYMYK